MIPAPSATRTWSTTGASTRSGAPSWWAAPCTRWSGYYGATASSAATGLTTCASGGALVTTAVPATGTGVAGGATITGSEPCGHPANKLGWVVTGGLRFNVPGGSYLQVQGGYTEGALRYISHTQWPLGSAAKFGIGNSLGVGPLMDGIFGPGTETELTKAWGIYGSWEQVWNPKWKTSLYGGWTAVEYNANATQLIAAATCGSPTTGGFIAGSGTATLGAITAAAASSLNSMASGSLANMSNCSPNWQMDMSAPVPSGTSPRSSTWASISSTPSSTPPSPGLQSTGPTLRSRPVSTASRIRTTSA